MSQPGIFGPDSVASTTAFNAIVLPLSHKEEAQSLPPLWFRAVFEVDMWIQSQLQKGRVHERLRVKSHRGLWESSLSHFQQMAEGCPRIPPAFIRTGFVFRRHLLRLLRLGRSIPCSRILLSYRRLASRIRPSRST